MWGLRFQDRNLGIWHRSADDVRERGCKSGTEGPQAGGTAGLSFHFVICGQYQKTVQTSNTKNISEQRPLGWEPEVSDRPGLSSLDLVVVSSCSPFLLNPPQSAGARFPCFDVDQ